jgi:hypothetical protein
LQSIQQPALSSYEMAVPSAGKRGSKRGSPVTQARAKAQRAKLDAQTEERQVQEQQIVREQRKKVTRKEQETRRYAIGVLIESYMQDHIGGNHSDKTLEWHRTALGLLHRFLQDEQQITQIDEVEANDISAWFAYLRTTPGGHGKLRTERTIQTYARSARAFFHWLVRRDTLQVNPLNGSSFPKWADL